jgi:hypothetical protein
LKDLADVDIVIEAASENVALKTALFTDLDKHCKPDAILATNTSSISITKIAAATARAEQVPQYYITWKIEHVQKLTQRIGYWNAFYESCACYETGGDYSWIGNH